MKFFLDTANVKEIQEAASLGLLDGVTTNPSLVAKEGRSFKEMLVEICNIVDGPISAEVVSLEADAMVKEGKGLAKIHKNIVVKVPLIAEGLKATKRLAAEGIKVNVTLCFSPTQALLAAKAGAWCVSPFIGRLDDISSNGMELIRQILTIYRNYDYQDPGVGGQCAPSSARRRGCARWRAYLYDALLDFSADGETSADG